MGHPIWDQYGTTPHMGAHIGPMWAPYRLLSGNNLLTQGSLQFIGNRCHDNKAGEPQGNTLIFASYVGSCPASTVHPPPKKKKYQGFQAPQKYLKF